MASKTVQYLDKAMNALRGVGLPIGSSEEQQLPVLKLLDTVSLLDSSRAAAIGAVMSQSAAFNAAVRDGIEGMKIYGQFGEITKQFDSIREDAAQMATWMSNGKLGLMERGKLALMNVRRGSVPERFDKIKASYESVLQGASKQLDIEQSIVNAYGDFSLSLKSVVVDADAMMQLAQAELDKCKAELGAANEALANVGVESTDRSSLELARDEAARKVQAEDRRFQICKDLAEDSRAGAATADAVFTRIQQQMAVKDRVIKRSIAFFAMSETTFTGLAVAFTGNAGLAEATSALGAMKDGMNKSLETLATAGRAQLEEGIKAGYGAGMDPQALKRFVDSIVDYQEGSLKLIAEARAEATAASDAIDTAVEDGRKRFTALLNQGA